MDNSLDEDESSKKTHATFFSAIDHETCMLINEKDGQKEVVDDLKIINDEHSHSAPAIQLSLQKRFSWTENKDR